MIHTVTWLPLPYQLTLCRALGEAYGPAFVAWFAERTHKDFPYRSEVQEGFVHHYLSEVGYGEFLRALRADPEAVVVLCGWSSPMTNRTLLLTTLLGIPVFVWADHPHPRKRSMLLALARKAFLFLLAHRVSGFLACGTPTLEYLVSLGIPRSKITNFPYWVEIPNQWSVPKRCLDRAASQRPLRLLAIGRHVRVKQFEIAIQAVAVANKKAGCDLVRLVLAGDGPERANLEVLAQSLNCQNDVSFPGWLEPGEVYDEIRQADAVVVTSSFEPYGVVVLEAMAAGRPVLASEGVTAALDRDEGTGAVLLHPSADVECLASQIVLLASDREKLRQASLASRSTAEEWPPERAISIFNDAIVRSNKRSNAISPEARLSHSEAKIGQASCANSIGTVRLIERRSKETK